MTNKTIRLATITVLLLGSTIARAQWECRSHLAANLNPVSRGIPLSWAGEIIASGGYLTDSYIANSMAFLGTELQLNRLQFYVEGGVKYWYKQDHALNTVFSASRFGLRELSANYTANRFKLTVGLQQMQSSDYFLLNERVAGLNLQYSSSGWNWQLAGGTVTKNFSRNGIFCSTAYLYDLLPNRTEPAGTGWGDTNFASLSFSREIGSHKPKPTPKTDADGFEVTDEFEAFDARPSKPKFGLKSFGAIVYSEFGSYYANARFYSGLNAGLSLSGAGSLKAEALFQAVADNQTMLYYLIWEKTAEWKNKNQTTLQLQYLGAGNDNLSTASLPRFSNLFWGEVFRMDAVDLPLLNASVKHQFTARQLSLKLQYSQQLKDDKMQELDFSIGKFYLKKHLRLTALTGLMNSEQLNNWAKLARLEMRIFF